MHTRLQEKGRRQSKKKEKKESSRWKVRGCNVRRWRFRMKQKLQRNLRRALDHRVL